METDVPTKPKSPSKSLTSAESETVCLLQELVTQSMKAPQEAQRHYDLDL